jgi:hypothetical protein
MSAGRNSKTVAISNYPISEKRLAGLRSALRNCAIQILRISPSKALTARRVELARANNQKKRGDNARTALRCA